jgi:transposase
MTTSVLKPKSTSKALSKEEKEAYVKRWQETSLSKSQFCKQEGISLSTFYSWFPRSVKKSFLPIRITPNVTKPSQLTATLKITLPSGLSIEGVFESISLRTWLKEIV